jgi:hypothetical protein
MEPGSFGRAAALGGGNVACVNHPDALDMAVRRFIDDPPWLRPRGLIEPGARPTERVAFEDGLTDEELVSIESRFRFTFPPDLRAMLSVALPISPGFPDWRSEEPEELERLLDWPADGVCFDITNNEFWLEGWGERPFDTDQACQLAREQIADAPVLIPIYGHRYIPAHPALEGNPVFSVYQTDIIYYGRNLADYLEREFRATAPNEPIADARHIPFWSDLP